MTEVNKGPLRGSANSYVTGDADPFRLRKANAFLGPLYVGGTGMVGGRGRWSGLCAFWTLREKNLNKKP